MKRATTLLLVALVAAPVAALVAAPAVTFAQPMDSFGLGSRGSAMAGAVTADVTDASANYYNPAGLIARDELRLMAGYMYASPELYIDGRRSGVDDISGVVFGLLVPGSVGGVRIAFGLGGHLPDGRISRTRSLPRRQPRWELYDNRPHRAYLAANLAVGITDWLRVGGGMGFQAMSGNTLYIDGTLGVFGAEDATDLEQRVNFALQTIRYPQLGVQLEPLPWVHVGAVYRGEYGLDSSLVGEVRGVLVAPGITPFDAFVGIETASTNAFVPQQLTVGVNLEPVAGLIIAAELTWLDWSSYRSPIGSSDVELLIGVPPELEGLISVPSSVTPGRRVPAYFEDRFVPRLGVEYKHDVDRDVALFVRGGYLYENSPAPPQTGFSNLVDADRHGVNLGGGVRLETFRPLLDGWLQLDFHLQAGFLVARDHIKDSPIDPIGDYRAWGRLWSGGLTLEVGFQ